MPAKPTPVIGYTIEFTVATNKVVHATDNNTQPRKYNSSPTLTEDELVVLCREVVEKATVAYRNGQRTFILLIDERGYILRDRAFQLANTSGSPLIGSRAEDMDVPEEMSESKQNLKKSKSSDKANKPKLMRTTKKAKKTNT
jgi:hypothetical protein